MGRLHFKQLVFLSFLMTIPAQASEQALNLEAIPVHFGAFTGIAYYRPEPQGYRVVISLANGDGAQPFRIETVLGPEQVVVLSSSLEDRSMPSTLTISRRGNAILFEGPGER